MIVSLGEESTMDCMERVTGLRGMGIPRRGLSLRKPELCEARAGEGSQQSNPTGDDQKPIHLMQSDGAGDGNRTRVASLEG